MRLLLKTFALLAVLPYLGVVFLIATGAASWSSIAYVVAIGVLLGGLITLPDPETKKRGRPRGLSRGAVVALAAIAIVRTAVLGDGRTVRMGDGSGAARGGLGSARFVDRLVDEGDVAVAGTRFLVAGGMLNDDRRELPAAMSHAYRDMRRDQGDVPSPFVATYLGLQSADAFDLVMIEPPHAPDAPDATAPPQTAIIFLHGFAGNFVLPCWQVARAVATSNTVTACPSTRWIGDWGSPAGEATLRRTVEALHARGIERIVLAGLSNGGYGASMLAPKMKGTFVGLVLISGAERDAPAAGIPTLVIHGEHDTMVRIEESREYAANTGAKLVTLNAGHFAMLVKAEESDRALRDFVSARAVARAER